MRFKSLLILLTSFLFMIFLPISVLGAVDPDEALKKDMKKNGYVSIDKAVKEFEKLNKKEVKLPEIPFKSNHKMGIVSKEDKSLSLQWINTKETPSKTFWMTIKLAENKLTSANPKKDEPIRLKDGTPAYFSNHHFYKLTFQKDGLEYCYMQRHSTTKEKFVQIAESFK